MVDHIDETAAALAEDWPLWEIWVVRHVQGGPSWCARRRDDHRTVLNAGSAEILTEYLMDVSGNSERGASVIDLTAHREVARLAVLFPEPWVINYRAVADVTIFTARRPGLAISKASAGALEDELWLWERAPRG